VTLVDQSTLDGYSHVLSRYILPEFKGHRLTEITYEAVVRWRDRLRRESEQLNLAAKTGVQVIDRQGRPKRPFGRPAKASAITSPGKRTA